MLNGEINVLDDDDLFFEPDERPVHKKSRKRIKARKKFPVLLTICGICLLMCGGGLTIGYFAIQKIAGRRSSIKLPKRVAGQFRTDGDEYNTSLATIEDAPSTDKRLLNFVRQTLADSLEGEDSPRCSNELRGSRLNSTPSRLYPGSS